MPDESDSEFSHIWTAIRQAIEPYEDAVLTEEAADSLASDVVALMEDEPHE